MFDLSIAVQDIIAIAVCVIAAVVLWRLVRRPKETGCSTCSQNPDTLKDSARSSSK